MVRTQSFFIGCTLPGMNEIIAAARISKGSWSRYSEMKSAFGGLCKSDIKKAKMFPMKRVVVAFLWQEKNRKRDKDNISAGQKFILDALVERQILANDGWDEIESIEHRWMVKADEPGVWVTLTEV